MSKGTTIKDAINKWEQAEAEKAKEQPDICCKASEAEHVSLIAQIPPIEKMDASLSTLQKCTRLSLSTNCIEKIANLNGLKNLQILSLGRNNIKSLTGLEAVGDTLLELWISYNKIEKLKGINVLKKLKVLYMSNNEVKEMGEFSKLADLPCLVELVFVGNPLCVALTDAGTYKDVVKGKLLKLKKLDGEPVIREQEEEES